MTVTADPRISMDDVPLGKLHWRVFGCSIGAPFIDGYALGIVAVALSVMNKQVDMSPAMSALIGMGTLAGMFVGSLLGGPITDALGRKTMFVLDFIFILAISVLSFFIVDPMLVLVMRFLLGVGLGADYPIAGPYLAEFIPTKARGALVGALNAFWFVGYAVSYVVGYFMLSIGDDSWRWMFASPALVALIWIAARWFMPESPRWLLSKGRIAEAEEVLQMIGPNVGPPKTLEVEKQGKFREIFQNGFGKWTLFVTGFWSLQLLPTFGIGTYTPTIMESLGFNEGNLQYLGTALINVFYLVGLIPIYFLIDRLGRRLTLIWPFIIAGVALALLAATSNLDMPFAFILVMFITFGAFTTAMGAHVWVYPNELFPTHVRGTAMGFITSATRVVAAVGTFAFPFVLDNFGLMGTLYICAGLYFLGAVVSYLIAPETKDMDLTDIARLTPKV